MYSSDDAYLEYYDYIDPKSKDGLTFKQVNLLKPHRFKFGDKVKFKYGQFEDGDHFLYVAELNRADDGSPTYSLIDTEITETSWVLEPEFGFLLTDVWRDELLELY